jgi:hypothetical protein
LIWKRKRWIEIGGERQRNRKKERKKGRERGREGGGNLLGDAVDRVEQVDPRIVVLRTLRHLAGSIDEGHHSRALLHNQRSGLSKYTSLPSTAELIVESPADISGELQVLPLVLSDRYLQQK